LADQHPADLDPRDPARRLRRGEDGTPPPGGVTCLRSDVEDELSELNARS
jgi:hypothetical protein